MTQPKERLLRVSVSILVVGLLLFLAYSHQRARFTQKVHAVFDPQQQAFRGAYYLPWPVGCPTLAGDLDPEAYRRVESYLGYEAGRLHTNGMTLILHPSSSFFRVDAD
jgi:hypothetical protein